jgi:hypothetical protein
LFVIDHRRSGARDDPQAQIRSVSPVLAQAQSEDGQAPQPRHLRDRAAAEKHERAVQYFKRGG